MTFAQAKIYSLITWDHRHKSGCTWKAFVKWVKKNHPEDIVKLVAYCGLCELYLRGGCYKCPLYKMRGSCCCKRGTLYRKWWNCKNSSQRKICADKIYKDIKKCKEIKK